MRVSTKSKYVFILAGFVTLASASALFNGCKWKKNDSNSELTGDTIADGKKLAVKYCTKCHELVKPELLIRDVWKYHTLPAMAKYAGISTYGIDYFKRDSSANIGATIQEWAILVAYYQKVAPVTLPAQKRPEPLTTDWAGFSVKLPSPVPTDKPSFTTLVAFNPDNKKIYSSDMFTSKLYEWDQQLKPTEVTTLPSGAVNALFSKTAAGTYQGIFSCIGQLEPKDFPNGRVVSVSLSGSHNVQDIETDLSRPVNVAPGDFNKDGLTDYVICAQGDLAGYLLWMKQNPDHTFTRNVIKRTDGAAQVMVGDFNSDGWPDIIALYGANNEGLYMYFNDRKGGFTEKQLLRFPPVYGSTSFQLADINHDGKPDIIYTAGYNYRDSRILKPYHGIYIFTNTGNWTFKQSFFYPINGCTKAIATDFDGDGDLDIITSAYFADLKNDPAESCVYFEQDSPGHFKPHAIPVSQYGRWYSMDVGDVNGDGKPDVILGNFSKGLSIQANVNTNHNEQIPLVVLENHMKK